LTGTTNITNLFFMLDTFTEDDSFDSWRREFFIIIFWNQYLI
jgi:hypothetical protein